MQRAKKAENPDDFFETIFGRMTSFEIGILAMRVEKNKRLGRVGCAARIYYEQRIEKRKKKTGGGNVM